MNDIEKILIKKCKKGNVEAFEKLISNYQKKIFNLCYRYVQNYDDAIELSQEVFIKIYKSISTFNSNSSLSTWIYKIATTTCIDEIRKRKKHNTVSIEESEQENVCTIEIADLSADPLTQIEKNELKIDIQNAISQLSEEFKTVIILRDIQGFSYNEIAEILSIPLGTVKSRIKRARNFLKDYLLQNGNFSLEVSSNK